MSSVTSDVCRGGSLSALLAFMRLQVPQHSLHVQHGSLMEVLSSAATYTCLLSRGAQATFSLTLETSNNAVHQVEAPVNQRVALQPDGCY
jgi:hypothetical protein